MKGKIEKRTYSDGISHETIPSDQFTGIRFWLSDNISIYATMKDETLVICCDDAFSIEPRASNNIVIRPLGCE